MDTLNTEQLLARWIAEYFSNVAPDRGLLRIRRGVPRLIYHNYFARFKVEVAKLDGTGQNPSDMECFVVEVSATDQTALIAATTACEAVPDL